MDLRKVGENGASYYPAVVPDADEERKASFDISSDVAGVLAYSILTVSRLHLLAFKFFPPTLMDLMEITIALAMIAKSFLEPGAVNGQVLVYVRFDLKHRR